MEAGLFCGMCADVLLGVAFFVGIGVFALGHILYLMAFCSLEKSCLRDLWLILPLSLISMFVVGTPWITVDDPVLRKLLLGYALIISPMDRIMPGYTWVKKDPCTQTRRADGHDKENIQTHPGSVCHQPGTAREVF